MSWNDDFFGHFGYFPSSDPDQGSILGFEFGNYRFGLGLGGRRFSGGNVSIKGFLFSAVMVVLVFALNFLFS